MRFSVRHRFDAPIERVERASMEPAFQERLAGLPRVGERRVVEHTERDDGTIRRVVFYRLGAKVPAAVTKVIGTDDITWHEVGEFDPARHEWRFEIRPSVFAHSFQCHGVYRYRPDGTGTARELEVDIRVKVPVVGRIVERTIRNDLVSTMEDETRLLREYLQS